MGGLTGCVGGRAEQTTLRLDRMLRSPTFGSASVSRARQASLAVVGLRDSDIVEDSRSGETLALAGYARLDGCPSTAASLLDAWRAHGEATLTRLSGEYALAVLGPDRVIVSRDALGTRPLYVADLPDGMIGFSTSLFALLLAGASPDIDYDAVVRSLVLGYPTAPATALRGVRQLGPGELWEVAPLRIERRWFRPRERIDAGRTLAASVRAVDDVLTAAVEEAVPAKGSVGAFLSGGIDSSIVLARVHESGTPVQAFTLYFGETLPGEIRYARAVAEHLGVRHHVLEIDARKFCAGIEPSVLHLEDVVSEAIAIPNFLLAREASRSVDTLFTGEGGDQSFGGPKNLGMAMAYAYRGHPSAPPLSHAYLDVHQYFWNDLREALEPGVLEGFDPEGLAEDVGQRYFGDRELRRRGSFVGRVMVGNTIVKGGNNILVKAAKMIGQAHDLALRSPMFHRRLVELAFTIPPWHKLDGTEEKLVLRRASLRSLPAWVVNRPKRGMTLPLAAWFDGELGALARDVLTQRAVSERGLMRWSYVERLLNREELPIDHARSRTIDKLWLALMTELHHRRIDEVARRARVLDARFQSVPGVAHA